MPKKLEKLVKELKRKGHSTTSAFKIAHTVRKRKNRKRKAKRLPSD